MKKERQGTNVYTTPFPEELGHFIKSRISFISFETLI